MTPHGHISDSLNDSLESHIVERLRKVPGVLSVVVRRTIDVTTTIAPEAGRSLVYDAEGELIDRFPDLLFDFHVTDKP